MSITTSALPEPALVHKRIVSWPSQPGRSKAVLGTTSFGLKLISELPPSGAPLPNDRIHPSPVGSTTVTLTATASTLSSAQSLFASTNAGRPPRPTIWTSNVELVFAVDIGLRPP